MIRIAPAATDADLGTFLDLVQQVHPGAGATAALLRHELETRPETTFLLALVDGVPAGAGTGMASSLGDALYAMARVLPAQRGRGVGGALLGALSEHARAVGRGSLVGRVLEDDLEARGFLERRGFTIVSRERPVALDLTQIPAGRPTPPAGVELASLAERPDLVEAAYAVEAEAVADIPVGAERPTPRSLAAWQADTVDSPDALLDLSLVALVDGVAVGWSGLASTGEDGVAENQLTGVRRAWRGRGIATALKREQAWRSREAGLRSIETTNDDGNASMRAVNARLGFEALPVWLLLRGPLAG